MKGWDPEGQMGPKKPLPDYVSIIEPQTEKQVNEPTSEQREPAVPVAPPPAEESFPAQAQEAYPAQDAYSTEQQPVF